MEGKDVDALTGKRNHPDVSEKNRKSQKVMEDEQSHAYDTDQENPFNKQSFIMWENTSNMCWLDASMAVLVHNHTMRCVFSLNPHAQVSKIINAYDKAIKTLNDFGSDQNTEERLNLAREILQNVQDSCLKYLQPLLKFKKGEPESAHHSLLSLIKEDKAIQDYFDVTYAWIRSCKSCDMTRVVSSKKPIITITNIENFEPEEQFSTISCQYCHMKDQKMKLIYKKLPPCLIFHFENGAGVGNNLHLKFKIASREYQLTAIMMMEKGQESNHFVTYIRDPKTEKWLECNDLDMDVTSFTSDIPNEISPDKLCLKDVYIYVFEAFDDLETVKMKEDPSLKNSNHTIPCIDLSDEDDNSSSYETGMQNKEATGSGGETVEKIQDFLSASLNLNKDSGPFSKPYSSVLDHNHLGENSEKPQNEKVRTPVGNVIDFEDYILKRLSECNSNSAVPFARIEPKNTLKSKCADKSLQQITGKMKINALDAINDHEVTEPSITGPTIVPESSIFSKPLTMSVFSKIGEKSSIDSAKQKPSNKHSDDDKTTNKKSQISENDFSSHKLKKNSQKPKKVSFSEEVSIENLSVPNKNGSKKPTTKQDQISNQESLNEDSGKKLKHVRETLIKSSTYDETNEPKSKDAKTVTKKQKQFPIPEEKKQELTINRSTIMHFLKAKTIDNISDESNDMPVENPVAPNLVAQSDTDIKETKNTPSKEHFCEQTMYPMRKKELDPKSKSETLKILSDMQLEKSDTSKNPENKLVTPKEKISTNNGEKKLQESSPKKSKKQCKVSASEDLILKDVVSKMQQPSCDANKMDSPNKKISANDSEKNVQESSPKKSKRQRKISVSQDFIIKNIVSKMQQPSCNANEMYSSNEKISACNSEKNKFLQEFSPKKSEKQLKVSMSEDLIIKDVVSKVKQPNYKANKMDTLDEKISTNNSEKRSFLQESSPKKSKKHHKDLDIKDIVSEIQQPSYDATATLSPKIKSDLKKAGKNKKVKSLSLCDSLINTENADFLDSEKDLQEQSSDKESDEISCKVKKNARNILKVRFPRQTMKCDEGTDSEEENFSARDVKAEKKRKRNYVCDGNPSTNENIPCQKTVKSNASNNAPAVDDLATSEISKTVDELTKNVPSCPNPNCPCVEADSEIIVEGTVDYFFAQIFETFRYRKDF